MSNEMKRTITGFSIYMVLCVCAYVAQLNSIFMAGAAQKMAYIIFVIIGMTIANRIMDDL